MLMEWWDIKNNTFWTIWYTDHAEMGNHLIIVQCVFIYMPKYRSPKRPDTNTVI